MKYDSYEATRMKSKPRYHWLIYVLCVFIFALIALDTMLWKIDPSGVVRYYHDFDALASLMVPSPDGIRYMPGQYAFTQYSLTITSEGFRSVPDNQGGACRIAFVGDSVTFGMGASDQDTFVNLLAPGIDATVINAALPAYSAGNVALLVDALPADGYVWLIIQNDDDKPMKYQRPSGGKLPSATVLYLGYFFPGEGAVPKDEGRFVDMSAEILARDDVMAFVFEAQKLTDVVQREFPQVNVIPYYTSSVSRFDAHPSAKGHSEIADSIRGQVATFVAQRCA